MTPERGRLIASARGFYGLKAHIKDHAAAKRANVNYPPPLAGDNVFKAYPLFRARKRVKKAVWPKESVQKKLNFYF